MSHMKTITHRLNGNANCIIVLENFKISALTYFDMAKLNLRIQYGIIYMHRWPYCLDVTVHMSSQNFKLYSFYVDSTH